MQKLLKIMVGVVVMTIFLNIVSVEAQQEDTGNTTANAPQTKSEKFDSSKKVLEDAQNKVKELQKKRDEQKQLCSFHSDSATCTKEAMDNIQPDLDDANAALQSAAVDFLKAQQDQIADQQFDTSKISIFGSQDQARVGAGQGVWGFVLSLIRFATGIAGALAVLGLCVGGVMFMVAAGDESQIQTAKMTLMYSLIGLVFVILSYVIVLTVQSLTYGLAQPF